VLARRVDGCHSLAAPRGSTLVVIGNFDGVHVGHRAVLEASLQIFWRDLRKLPCNQGVQVFGLRLAPEFE
jgi:FAD synthase